HQSIQNDLSLDTRNLSELNHLDAIRKQMIQGKVPAECSGCFALEKSGCSSPRHDYLRRFPIDPDHTNPTIRYLDLTVDNDCNLECVMCSPVYSRRLIKFFKDELYLENDTK